MTIIIEDGTIVAGANAYASLIAVDSYHNERLSTVWTNASEAAKEPAMLRATAGMETRYFDRWTGVKADHNATTAPQFLAWPRRALKTETRKAGFKVATMTKIEDSDGLLYDVDSIPAIIVQAYKEICLVEIAEPFVSIRLARNDMLKYQRVDVIEQEWLRNAPALTTFPHIDQMLAVFASSAVVQLGASIGLTEAEQDSIDATGAFDRWFTSLLVS